MLSSAGRWQAALTPICRRHSSSHAEGRVTSNVGQNYPYTSETEADRAAQRRGARRGSRGPRRHAAGRVHPARPQRPLVGLEVPDHRLPGPAPRRRLREREARRLRRLRRDLREDVPALTPAAPMTRTTGAAPEPTWDLRAARRQLLLDGLGIAASAIGFGLVLGLAARDAGYSPLEALAMSVIVFAGASQFAAVGLRRGRAPVAADRRPHVLPQRPPPAVQRVARAAAPRRPVPPAGARWRTSSPTSRSPSRPTHFQRLGRVDIPGYWIAAVLRGVHPLEPRDDRRRPAGRRDPRPGGPRARRRVPGGDGRARGGAR